jgi:hypothetical protein
MNKQLVVVAHADDETLWCGGWLIEHPGTDVLCASIPRNDTQRIADFFTACKMLGANGIVCGRLESEQNVRDAQIYAQHYDTIITHNQLGEYGHKLHIKLHYAMHELNLPMRVFGYGIRPGMPIDIDKKLAALACYSTRPNMLKNQSRRFDLSRECLI